MALTHDTDTIILTMIRHQNIDTGLVTGYTTQLWMIDEMIPHDRVRGHHSIWPSSMGAATGPDPSPSWNLASLTGMDSHSRRAESFHWLAAHAWTGDKHCCSWKGT